MTPRRICSNCGERPAGFWQRWWRRWIGADDHGLCGKCWTAEQDRNRQRRLNEEKGAD